MKYWFPLWVNFQMTFIVRTAPHSAGSWAFFVFDIWSFNAASDFVPTQRRSSERLKDTVICLKAKKWTEPYRKSTTTSPCKRETHTLSLALQMLEIGSIKRPHARTLNPSIVRDVRSGLAACVGVELGSSGWNSLWICVGFKAFLLSQPNVKVRM